MGGDGDSARHASSAEMEEATAAPETHLFEGASVDAKQALTDRLAGREPSEIVPCLEQGDPLGIQRTCMRVVREEGYVFDPDRVFRKALLEVALEASLATPGMLRPGWVQRSVERAVGKLLNEDRERLRDPREAERHTADYRFLHDAFATPPEECLEATVEFHALPHRARLAFFLLLVDNMQVDDVLAIGHWEPEELRMDVWEALRALGHLSHDEVETFRNRKRRRHD